MTPTFKEMTNYFIEIGAGEISHSEKTYMAHGIGVYNDLRAWGESDELCRAALFHSIYGTQQFQGFTLPVEKRGELQEFIGSYAEKIAYLNCFMFRDSLDNQLDQPEGPYIIIHRESGEEMELTLEEYNDLARVHLCDWLEQVERSGDWGARRVAYRKMAERLGGVALDSYDKVFAREPKQVANA